ncbi:hypothetical protein Zmor_013747 [Zophobas morio]|uniref:Uncharacterized protein n=1 Tax=Zophobas morio TaxID=2755281 RepID=A0AA38IJD5_9CUCU|nr:hypothetical protein Zmor_013747 [Zophobas morio]
MIIPKVLFYLTIFAVLCAFSKDVDCSPAYPIRSDSIETKWPENKNVEEKEPGWMRKQLMRFGEVASRVGNSMGAHAAKISSAIDKVCEIVKTVIPLLTAVCHVGQFKFCAATTQAPDQLTEALNPSSLNLDEPDRK